jgi:hypothetical protein
MRTSQVRNHTETKAPVADRVAEDEVGDSLGRDSLSDAVGDTIFRKAVSMAPSGDPNESFGDATSGQGGGVPYQSEMESAFGRSFSDVSSHTGQSGPMARLGAEAATRGSTVAFADTHPSKSTVAHELAHVVQGSGGGATGGGVAPSGSSAEKEADAAASAVTSGESPSIGGSLGGIALLERQLGSKKIDVPPEVSYGDFKTKTYVRFASRGENLSAIDRFLQAADAATTVDDLAYAARNAKAAADHWLQVHAAAGGRSVEARKPAVTALVTKLGVLEPLLVAAGANPTVAVVNGPGTPDPTEWKTAAGNLSMGGPQAPKDDEYGGNDGIEVANKVAGAWNDPMGIPGAGGDIHGDGNQYKDIAENTKFKSAEGVANTISGGVGMVAGIDQVVNGKGAYQKTMGVGKTLAGGAQVVSGVAKTVSATQKGMSDGASTEDAIKSLSDASDKSGKVSDGAAGVVGGLSALMEGADLVKGLSEAGDLKDGSIEQRVEWTVARAKNVAGIVKGVADSVNGFTKVATGAASTAASTVGAGAGVALGGIDVVHGAYQMITAGVDKSRLTGAEKKMTDAISSAKTQVQDIDVVLPLARREKAVYERKKTTEATAAKRAHAKRRAQALGVEILDLETSKLELTGLIGRLEAMQVEFGPVLDGMRQVQNRRMKKGAFKAVTGAIDVATGALILSGVGAPVAIALGVFNGLLKLGNFVLDVGRKNKASKLTNIAVRLDDSGRAKGKPDDPNDVGYRAMESRVTNSYYKHYSNAIEDKAPSGINGDDWGHVRDFVQEAKLDAVAETAKTQHASRGSADSASEAVKRSTWAEYKVGSDTKEERPGFLRRRGLNFTFSAHKSEQAIDASNSELASGVVRIAMSAFNPDTKSFIPTQVTAQDPEKGVRAATASALLKNVGVTESIWQNMWRKNGGWFKDDPVDATAPTGAKQTAHKGPNFAAMNADMTAKVKAVG